MEPEQEGFDGVGKLNRYDCNKCGGSIVTVDRERGVTPFMLRCRATPGCGGTMTSAMYRGVHGKATYEWRKPTPTEYAAMSPQMKEHVDQGGLEIYPIDGAASNSVNLNRKQRRAQQFKKKMRF